MKFVFFGSPEFAEIILEHLVRASFVPSLIITNPDRPFGRKQIITPPPTKLFAIKHGIKVWQPEKLETKNWELETENFKLKTTDFAIVAAYAKILPKEIVEMPRLGTIGVHPSLLPKYRGAAPIQSAILGGEAETGVTLYLMDEKVDHGPMLATGRLGIAAGDTHHTLLKKLAKTAGDLLIDTIPKFLGGEITPQPQDDSQATFTKKFKTEDAYVDPVNLERAEREGGEIVLKIDRMIRALNSEPGVWTMQGGKRVKLLSSTIESGKLKLLKIQVEGKKPTMVV